MRVEGKVAVVGEFQNTSEFIEVYPRDFVPDWFCAPSTRASSPRPSSPSSVPRDLILQDQS